MRNLVSSTKALTAATILLFLTACSGPYFKIYRSAISENQQALQRLQLGMSAAEVRSTMGVGEMVQYKKLYLVDPWRSEAFSLVDGSNVLILFYLTQPPRKYYHAEDHDLTPIIIENDQLVGWGWSYLRHNTDRYHIEAPKLQR